MYINMNFKAGMLGLPPAGGMEVSGTDEQYWLQYFVQENGKGHIGDIYFSKEQEGTGYVEWCTGDRVRGFGKRITVDQLIDFIEANGAQKYP